MQLRFKLLLPVLIAGSIWRCTSPRDNHPGAVEKRDFRQDMRRLVQTISAYAKKTNPDFIIIPQNGHGLLTLGDDTTAGPASAYLAAIDGVGREDLFFGYNADNQATPASERDEMLGFMDLAEAHGLDRHQAELLEPAVAVGQDVDRRRQRRHGEGRRIERVVHGHEYSPSAPRMRCRSGGQESGIRDQESGVRDQESGVRDWTS